MIIDVDNELANTSVIDKVAIVTGRSGRTSEGIAPWMACERAIVVVSGRTTEQAQQIIREIREAGGQTLFVRADIAPESDCAG